MKYDLLSTVQIRIDDASALGGERNICYSDPGVTGFRSFAGADK